MRKRALVCVLAASAATVSLASVALAAAPTTDDEKALYSMGAMMSRSLAAFDLNAEELEFLKAGLTDSVLGRDLAINPTEQGPIVQAFAKAREERMAAEEKKASEAFLAKVEAEAGATKTDSGLIYFELEPGEGASPTAADEVTVHYTGTLIDGTVFDSSVERGQPATFPLGRVIPCWTEGVQKMKVGGKSKLICPSSIGYGDRGSPPVIKPGATLVFEVELLAIGGAPHAE